MATTRFDTISKLFARREAADRSSQAATPAAWDGEKIPYLFVQSFEGGTIEPKAGTDGAYTVTLEHGLGQTLYFGDRPSHDVGAVPTPQFLEVGAADLQLVRRRPLQLRPRRALPLKQAVAEALGIAERMAR
jgi:hypothetical protein